MKAGHNLNSRDATPDSMPRRFHWTRDQFYRLSELRFFHDRRHCRERFVELIGGQLLETPPPTPFEYTAIALTADCLRAAFGAGYHVSQRGVLDLGKFSQPRPDLMVLKGGPRDYPEYPTNAELVVEISGSTLKFDRGTKGRLYARSNIPVYWVVNLIERQLEIHREVRPSLELPGRFIYGSKTVVSENDAAIPLTLSGPVIPVKDMLP